MIMQIILTIIILILTLCQTEEFAGVPQDFNKIRGVNVVRDVLMTVICEVGLLRPGEEVVIARLR